MSDEGQATPGDAEETLPMQSDKVHDGHGGGDDDGGGSDNDCCGGGDILYYIIYYDACLFVTKNLHFLLGVSCYHP